MTFRQAQAQRHKLGLRSIYVFLEKAFKIMMIHGGRGWRGQEGANVELLFLRVWSLQCEYYYRGHLNKSGQSDYRTITINFNQSRLKQSRVDGKQQLKPKSLELFTVRFII